MFSPLERFMFRYASLELLGKNVRRKKILVIGIYLSEVKNYVNEITDEFSSSKFHDVEQIWVSIGDGEISNKFTMQSTKKGPKFILLNKVLSEINYHKYDYIIFCDDDVLVKNNFIDKYMETVEKVDFALSQPARSTFSELSHTITKVDHSTIARQTNFVEIGPIFMIRTDLVNNTIPFDESSPMGWGYDYTWPIVVGDLGLKMGIIDSATVNHSIRKTALHYSAKDSYKVMEDYLRNNSHIKRSDSFKVLHKYYND